MLSDVVEPRFRWSFPGPVTIPPGFAEAGRRFGYSERLIGLLARRGISEAELPTFSGPPEGSLFDAGLLPDAAVLPGAGSGGAHRGSGSRSSAISMQTG